MSAVLIIVSMTIFTYLVVEQESKTLSSELKKQAVALADNLAASTASYIIVKDYTSLESILIRAARFPSIKDIQVSNDEGMMLGDVYRNSAGEIAVNYKSKAALPPAEAEREIKIKDGIIVVWQPVVLGDLVGWIRTRYTLHRIEEVRAQIWLHNASIGSIVVVVTILLFYLYLRRPFHLIEQSAKFADELDAFQVPAARATFRIFLYVPRNGAALQTRRYSSSASAGRPVSAYRSPSHSEKPSSRSSHL